VGAQAAWPGSESPAVAEERDGPWGVVEGKARPEPRLEQVRVGEPGGAAVVRGARRAWGEPRAAAAVVAPRLEGQAPVSVCHNIRRICFPMEMTYGNSGT